MNHDPLHTMTPQELAEFVNEFLQGIQELPSGPGNPEETILSLLALLIGRIIVFSFDDIQQRKRLAQMFTSKTLAVVANHGYGSEVRRH
jgi:hypothetical protein